MRLAYDLDGVLLDWIGAFVQEAQNHDPVDTFPRTSDQVLQWDLGHPEELDRICKLIDWSSFLRHQVQPLVNPRSLPVRPVAYVTHRSEASRVDTEYCLTLHGFPMAPIIHVPDQGCKADAVRDSGATHFVEDHYDTFLSLHEAGIHCFLMDAPYNRDQEDFGRRIRTIDEILTL